MKKIFYSALFLTIFYHLHLICSANQVLIPASTIDKPFNCTRILEEECAANAIDWEIYAKRMSYKFPFLVTGREAFPDCAGLHRVSTVAEKLLKFFMNDSTVKKEDLFFLGPQSTFNELPFDSFTSPQLYSSLLKKSKSKLAQRICYYNMDPAKPATTGLYKESYVSSANSETFKNVRTTAFLCWHSDYKKLLHNIRQAKKEKSHAFVVIMTAFCGTRGQGHSGALIVTTEKKEKSAIKVTIFCIDSNNVAYKPQGCTYGAQWFLPAIKQLQCFFYEKNSLENAIISYLFAVKHFAKARSTLCALGLNNLQLYRTKIGALEKTLSNLYIDPLQQHSCSIKKIQAPHYNYSVGMAFAAAECVLRDKITVYEQEVETHGEKNKSLLNLKSKYIRKNNIKKARFTTMTIPDSLIMSPDHLFIGQIPLHLANPMTYALLCHDAATKYAFLTKDENQRLIYKTLVQKIVYLAYDETGCFKSKSELHKLLQCKKKKNNFFVIVTNTGKNKQALWNAVIVRNNKVTHVVGDYDHKCVKHLSNFVDAQWSTNNERNFLVENILTSFHKNYSASFAGDEKKRLHIQGYSYLCNQQ